jgi:hypothetical protein
MLAEGLSLKVLALRIAAAAAVGGAMCGRAAPAFAYRPFDGTDAAVADPGQVEVELQPAGRLQEGASCCSRHGGQFWADRGIGSGVRGAPSDTPVFFRAAEPDGCGNILAIRPRALACCKTKTGPSIATEFGVLYPELERSFKTVLRAGCGRLQTTLNERA